VDERDADDFEFARGDHEELTEGFIVEIPTDVDSLTLRFKRSRALPILLLVAAGFLINFIVFFGKWNEAPYYMVHVTGVIFLPMLALYIIGPHVYYLRLTPEGLQVRLVGRNSFYNWRDIRNIRLLQRIVNGVPVGKGAIFDLKEGSEQRSIMTGLAKAVSGHHVEIPAIFGRGPEELVAVLIAWQTRYAPTQELPPVETPPDFQDRFKQWQQQYGQGSNPSTGT
jgi:hypothetical protein